MKKGNSDPLSAELKAELAALEAMPDDEIDTSDAPEVTNWKGAEARRVLSPSQTAAYVTSRCGPC